jgi:hypothetical protein
MKATITIFAAALILNAGIMFAANETTSASATADHTSISSLSLAPVMPNEADFNDVAPDIFTDVIRLAPVTPSEADFSDSTAIIDIHALAPVTPVTADFE